MATRIAEQARSPLDPNQDDWRLMEILAAIIKNEALGYLTPQGQSWAKSVDVMPWNQALQTRNRGSEGLDLWGPPGGEYYPDTDSIRLNLASQGTDFLTTLIHELGHSYTNPAKQGITEPGKMTPEEWVAFENYYKARNPDVLPRSTTEAYSYITDPNTARSNRLSSAPEAIDSYLARDVNPWYSNWLRPDFGLR